MVTTNNKGFTLIELLVVIAIIGVLAAVVLLAINPAELLRKGRDTTRLQDLVNLRKAIDATMASGSVTGLPCVTASCVSTTGTQSSAGTGWISGNGGTNIVLSTYIPALPFDPVNNATYFYTFRSNANLEYELDATLESTANASKMSNDGGNSATTYETGTNLTIL